MPRECPFCRGQATSRVRFTAWGGVIGPAVFALTKCACCGGHFNGRTGRCVKRAIRVYTLTALVLLALITALVVYQISGGRTERAAKGSALVSES